MNTRSIELLPKDIAELLPSNPKHVQKMVLMSYEYWADNEEKVKEKLDEWLAK